MDRDVSELTRWTRIIVRHEECSSFAVVSPFLTADQIREVVGEVRAARALASGALLITTLTTNQAENMTRLNRFMEKRARCEPADH